MKNIIVIPTYWSRPSHTGWKEGNMVYDHPTPIDEDGTLERTLNSMKILKDEDYKLVLLLSPTAEEILDQAFKKVRSIVKKVSLDVQTYIVTFDELNKIKDLAQEYTLSKQSMSLMSLSGYANVRNMCLYIPFVLGADAAILIDDDEIFEKEDFISVATEFIGGRLYGKTIDGLAGYYLNKDHNYYDNVDR